MVNNDIHMFGWEEIQKINRIQDVFANIPISNREEKIRRDEEDQDAHEACKRRMEKRYAMLRADYETALKQREKAF